MTSTTATTPPGPSLQEQYFPDLTCFGCGPANDKGLHLRSYLAGDGSVVARFMPWPEHDNGAGFLNGGIIATLLDCHSAAAVVTAAVREGYDPAPGAALTHVTAGIDVAYRRPAPLHDTVDLVAETIEVTEPRIIVGVRLEWDGKVRAEATVDWRRWRPR